MNNQYRKILGLKRNTVQLISYQDEWEIVFLSTKKHLEQLIGQYVLDIQHVGSTSIKGIAAKPIIDIAVCISQKEIIKKIIPILESNDYEYRGDAGENGGYLFVKSLEPEVRTHHIHIVESCDEQWSNYLYFRDELRKNENLAQSYLKLKQQLADEHSENRKLYTAGKDKFIREVLRLALAKRGMTKGHQNE